MRKRKLNIPLIHALFPASRPKNYKPDPAQRYMNAMEPEPHWVGEDDEDRFFAEPTLNDLAREEDMRQYALRAIEQRLSTAYDPYDHIHTEDVFLYTEEEP